MTKLIPVFQTPLIDLYNTDRLTTYLWDDNYDINGLYLNFKCLPDDPKLKEIFLEKLKTLLFDLNICPYNFKL